MALNERQKRFAEEYAVDFNACQAAIRAGYAEASASQQAYDLLRNPHLQDYIAIYVKKRVEKVEVTVESVLKTIKETIERCKDGELVRDRKGNPVTVTTDNGEVFAIYKFDSNAVLKGSELLGKYLAMFTEKREVSGAIDLNVKGLDDAELDAQIKALS